jgi:ABC-2 type transport system ATP-binding protein
MEEAARLCDRVAVVDYGKVIALGTPRELIASLGAEHVIEFAIGEQPEAAGLIPPPRAAQRGGAWRMTVCIGGSPSGKCIEPFLLCSQVLAERGAEPMHLATHHATLEDVFMNLTGRRLRDG